MKPLMTFFMAGFTGNTESLGLGFVKWIEFEMFTSLCHFNVSQFFVSVQVFVRLHERQFSVQYAHPPADGGGESPLPQAPPHTHREAESDSSPRWTIDVAQGKEHRFRH